MLNLLRGTLLCRARELRGAGVSNQIDCLVRDLEPVGWVLTPGCCCRPSTRASRGGRMRGRDATLLAALPGCAHEPAQMGRFRWGSSLRCTAKGKPSQRVRRLALLPLCRSPTSFAFLQRSRFQPHLAASRDAFLAKY